jgi:DNA-binding response OmpR family regulator
MSKILIADDEVNIAALIADSLSDEGFETVVVHDGPAVLSELSKDTDFNLIILDIMMPGIDGLEICRRIRDTVKCPIIFVTAKSRTLDTLLGLELGADDYITKPFVVEELTAKVKAHIRRDKRMAETEALSDTLTIGELTIKKDSFEVYINDKRIDLSTREFQLLAYLAENIGRVLTREQIFDAVWGMAYSDIGSVTVTIKNLRDKIDPDNRYIKTIWGVGYKMVKAEVDGRL